MKLRAAGLSDIGRRRTANQDQFVIDESIGLFAVADGMGGHAAGEVAAGLAIDALRESLADESGDASAAGDKLQHGLNAGNRRICESMEQRPEWNGMGTTMVAMLQQQDAVTIGHAGDSRAYLWRGGELRLLTSDHSWVNEQVRRGLLSPDEANRHPMRNIVTRALGNQPTVEVDVTDETLRPGDLFLLCSDGLNGMIDDGEIGTTLARHADVPAEACRALVEAANEAGGDDNITVVVVRCDDGASGNTAD